MSALANGRYCLAAGALAAIVWAWPHHTADARQAVPSRCETEATWSLPMWFRDWFDASAGLKSRYDIACYLNPFYHRANFDGRGQLDLAVLVVERTTGKRGILFVHRPGLAHFILGAGTEFGSGGDDFEWMDVWSVDKAPREESGKPEAGIVAEVLDLVKSESASGWVGFDGQKYVWVQGSD